MLQPSKLKPQELTINPDLAALHGQLIAVVDRLNQAFSRATTRIEAIAILDEISDVNARVASVGRQLFTRQTEAITLGAEKVTAALPELEAAIDRSDDLKKFVSGVTKFLKLVDAAVDLAKVVV